VSGSLPEGVRHVFVIDVKGGRGAYKYIPSLRAAEAMTGALDEMPAARPMPEFVEAISNDLVRRLVQSGLFEKEARAMANTWRSSYFESEGIRALFVLPQAWTDRFIPMYLDPKPARVVRVMVGRIELLSKERERQAERAVQDLASSDSHRRSAAFEFLRKQGRYVEPVLRRIAATSKEPNVARMCRRLLLTDWITDLRAASRDAETGRELEEDPLEVRAQLAVLLRDAGLAAEAQEEGRRVIAGYSQRQLPPTTNDEARKHLRALARAAEAIGDDVQAKERYEEFIRFGAQTKTCGGCHLVAGPRDFGFFRDWWAGERYARVVERLGRTTADIVALEKRAATASAETSDRIRLAYLLKSAGRGRESDTHWAKLDGGRGKKLAATDR
jgi:hypothetical protein